MFAHRKWGGDDTHREQCCEERKSFMFVRFSIALYTAPGWKYRHKNRVYISLPPHDRTTLSLLGILCQDYILENNIEKLMIAKRKTKLDIEAEREKDENNGVSHHFIYKIKVPFICHRYRYYTIFTGVYFQQHNISSPRLRQKSFIFLSGLTRWHEAK